MDYMKMINRNIDSDALDPFFQERMSEADLKYYKYFNKLWNTGYYRGTLFDPKHVREIKNMVRQRQDTDIYENYSRLDSESGDIIIENHTYEDLDAHQAHNVISLTMADSISANEGLVCAISYVANQLKDLDPIQDLKGNLSKWVAIISRIVAEERRAKSRKSVSLSDLQTQSLSTEGQIGINKKAVKLLKNKQVYEVITDLINPFAQELNDAGSDVLRRQMLFDRGLLIAALIKKGYHKRYNKRKKK